jgi:hypothetical protein
MDGDRRDEAGVPSLSTEDSSPSSKHSPGDVVPGALPKADPDPDPIRRTENESEMFSSKSRLATETEPVQLQVQVEPDEGPALSGADTDPLSASSVSVEEEVEDFTIFHCVSYLGAASIQV